jgi:phenylacetate-CoA ligase
LREIEQVGDRHSARMELRKSIFQYHIKHNDFYKNTIKRTEFSKWENIPILTKDMLHVPLNERISEPYRNKKILKAKTSGSSGFPFSYAKNKFCHALTWAHILNTYNEIGVDYGNDYQARFYGIPKNGIAQNIEQLKDKLSNRKRFVIFDLTDHKLDEFISLFQNHKFDYVYGYSSSIVLFAEHLKKKGLKLKALCPSVKLCITTSEMLFPSDRDVLEKQFEIPVYNEYGASEFGLIAFENKERKFILNDKTIYTEIVDEEGHILPHGEVGRIVITSIYNKAHPFIRYEVGDLGSISIDKFTGKQVLSKLVGRTNEFALLENGKRIPAFTFYYIAKEVSHDIESIKELKIIQIETNTFQLEYTATKLLNPDEKQGIQNAFYKYLESKVHLEFEKKASLSRSKNGKLKQFESRV